MSPSSWPLACEQLESWQSRRVTSHFPYGVGFWDLTSLISPTQEFLDLYPKEDFVLPEYGSYRNRLQGNRAHITGREVHHSEKDDQLIIPSAVNWDEWTEIIRHAFDTSPC